MFCSSGEVKDFNKERPYCERPRSVECFQAYHENRYWGLKPDRKPMIGDYKNIFWKAYAQYFVSNVEKSKVKSEVWFV